MNLNKFKELLSVPSKTYQEDRMVNYLLDELSQIKGIQVVCEYVEVEIGGQTVLIDPLRVIGF